MSPNPAVVEIGPGAPNLDALHPDELTAFSDAVDEDPLRVTSKLFFEPRQLAGFPNRWDDCVHETKRLARYARLSARARPLRAGGDLAAAQRLERTAESVYGQLPDWARW